jgi:FtsZ-interacting cell division protein ZipA
MKNLKAFLPYILAVALFFAGRWSSPDDTKELEEKFEQERRGFRNQITNLNLSLIDKDKGLKEIREKRHQDRVRDSIELRAKDRVILKQQKENEKINLSRATSEQLDSIRAIILRSVN